MFKRENKHIKNRGRKGCMAYITG